MNRLTSRSLHEPLDISSGACDVISNAESKSVRRSACCFLRNYVVRFILCTVILLCFVWYKFNSIEATVSNLRVTANEYLFAFELKSSAFQDGQSISSKYNTTLSPPLQWTNPPQTTKSFALIVEDLDTPNLFKHWILYNIPSTISKLSEGMLVWPAGTAVLRNDFIRYRYDGPMPYDGRDHRYAFRLFALSEDQLILSSGSGRVPSYEDLRVAMDPFIIKEATLTGTYNVFNHD
jgi:Raf kinase inhibitor-like YbhB/YbcL family protein